MENRLLIPAVAAALIAGLGLGAGGMYLASTPETVVPPLEAEAPALPRTPAASASPPPAVPAPAAPSAPPAGPATLPDTGDADRAYRGVQSGEMLPLVEILAKVRERLRFSGEIVSTRLDEDDGVVEYEIRVLAADGRVIDVRADARTGRILSVESPSDDDDDDDDGDDD